MHDNAIHDLALACWSVLLSPIKRTAPQSSRNSQGKVVCDCWFFNRNKYRHFVLVRGKKSIAPVLSAVSSSTANQNGDRHRAFASEVAKVKNGRPDASVHGFVRPFLVFHSVEYHQSLFGHVSIAVVALEFSTSESSCP